MVHKNQLQHNTSSTLLTPHCERESDAKAGTRTTGKQPNLLGVTLDTRLMWKTHLEAVSARSMRKLDLLKKLGRVGGGGGGAQPGELTQTSCEGSTQEQPIPSWSMPQPSGPPLQMPTRASWTKKKLLQYEPLLVPWKQRPWRRWRREQTWSPGTPKNF